jgi:hypothetical protein
LERITQKTSGSSKSLNKRKFFKNLLPDFRKCRLAFVGIFILTIAQLHGYGQENGETYDPLNLTQRVDLIDVIRKWRGKPPKVIPAVPQPHVRNLSLLPIVGYSPANGFVIGSAISVTEYRGDPKTTNLSSGLLNVSFTTKEQVLLNLKYDVYLKDNTWYISGDNRLLFFAQPTYGLGIYGLQGQSYHFGLNGSSVVKTDSEQPMRFNYIRLYETFSKRIYKKWYAGLGLMIDFDFNIKDESLSLDSPVNLTSHYIYSNAYGFDTAKYWMNGLALHIMHDSRDNPVNPYTGDYFNLNFRYNATAFGSTQPSTMLYYEFRKYFGVKKSVPRNVLAFWFWGVIVGSGHAPYLTLPAITWDTYNRSGRGYIQGRFRGSSMLYEEAEYRFRLSKSGLFGGVVFANFTTASNPLTGQSVFNAVAPGYGFGLRIKMNKSDRTNIAIDYGMGDGFASIYFNIREAF